LRSPARHRGRDARSVREAQSSGQETVDALAGRLVRNQHDHSVDAVSHRLTGRMTTRHTTEREVAMPENADQPGRTDQVMARLDDQIGWYSRAATRNRRGHWTLRIASLIMAASVPLTVLLDQPSVVAALLGAGIVVAEGAHELFRLQQNWTSYAATAEALKHEKYLFLAGAGPYRNEENPRPLLAERIEAMISGETAQWVALQQSTRAGEAGTDNTATRDT
jgi:hypothetical protein